MKKIWDKFWDGVHIVLGSIAWCADLAKDGFAYISEAVEAHPNWTTLYVIVVTLLVIFG